MPPVTKDVRRYDFPETDPIVPGEGKILRFTVRERTGPNTWVNASSFAQYANTTFFLMDKAADAGTTDAERKAKSVFWASATPGTPPYMDVILSPAQTALVRTGARWYELWTDYDGVPTRLAYGHISFVD